MNVAEKTVKFHYNGTPTKSGWYYCNGDYNGKFSEEF